MFNLNRDSDKPGRVALYARVNQEGDDHDQQTNA